MPLIITPGEPAGIGPELVVQLVQQHQLDIVALCDPKLIQQRACALGLPLTIHPPESEIPSLGGLRVEPLSLSEPSIAGELNLNNSNYVVESLRRAIDGCLAHKYEALVTGPIHKGVINRGGFLNFTGHTEFLAQRCGIDKVVMMLTTAFPTQPNPGHELRVPLVTTHLPLSEVSQAITPQALIQVITIVDHTLRNHYKIANPHILVCGLNPHAGEDGYLGMEEIKVINPVIQSLKALGLNLTGSVPADTAFTRNNIESSDAIIAMYHDQGLTTLKHLGFGNAVNITLGLPFIRTSVDHGTALDLAGSGKASYASLLAAIHSAQTMTA